MESDVIETAHHPVNTASGKLSPAWSRILRLLRWSLYLVLLPMLVVGVLLFAVNRTVADRQTGAQTEGAPAEGRLVQALPLDPSFGRIFIQSWGPADATPVLIAPGAVAWSGFWADTGRALAARGYRVIAVDLPPFGYSDHDPEARYGRADQAARLIGILDELDACRGVLIGHSTGGGAVVEAMLRHAHRIEGAILVAPDLALPPDGEEPGEPSWLVSTVLETPWARRTLTAATLANPWLSGHLLSRRIERQDAATDARIELLARPLSRTGTTDAYAAWLPFMLGPARDAISRRSDGLTGIELPVALIWGEADRIVPLEQGRRLSTLIPGATLDVLPGVGHVPHIEAPDDTIGLLLAQLARVSPNATDRNAPRRLDLEACALGGTGTFGRQ